MLLAVLSSVALSQVNLSHVHSCFFCDEPETPGEKLRDVMTLELDRKVKQCANKLQDNKLLVKLSNASDMVALEAKYHLKCLASLYNRVRSIERKQSFEPNKPEHTKSLVFAQLVSYIDECRLDDSAIPVFRLGDLVKLYNERFTQLGGLGGAHSTRLKEQLLAQFPDMHAYDEGRDVLLMLIMMLALQLQWLARLIGSVMHCACPGLHRLFAKISSNLDQHLMVFFRQTARNSLFQAVCLPS